MKKVEYTLTMRFVVDEDKCEPHERGEAMVQSIKDGFVEDFRPDPDDPEDPVMESSIDVQRVDLEAN